MVHSSLQRIRDHLRLISRYTVLRPFTRSVVLAARPPLLPVVEVTPKAQRQPRELPIFQGLVYCCFCSFELPLKINKSPREERDFLGKAQSLADPSLRLCSRASARKTITLSSLLDDRGIYSSRGGDYLTARGKLR